MFSKIGDEITVFLWLFKIMANYDLPRFFTNDLIYRGAFKENLASLDFRTLIYLSFEIILKTGNIHTVINLTMICGSAKAPKLHGKF